MLSASASGWKFVTEWEERLGDTLGDYLVYSEMITDSNGDYVAVGYADNVLGGFTGRIIKIAPDGSVIWLYQLEDESFFTLGTDFGVLNSIVETDDGNYLVGGYIEDGVNDGSIILKISDAGALIWVEYPVEPATIPWHEGGIKKILPLGNDQYICLGDSYGVVYKLEDLGTSTSIEWSYSKHENSLMAPANFMQFSDVREGADGSLYFIGQYWGQTYPTRTDEKALILKLDADGNYIDEYAYTLDTHWRGSFQEFVVSPNGKVFISGEYQDTDVSHSTDFIYSHFVIEFDETKALNASLSGFITLPRPEPSLGEYLVETDLSTSTYLVNSAGNIVRISSGSELNPPPYPALPKQYVRISEFDPNFSVMISDQYEEWAITRSVDNLVYGAVVTPDNGYVLMGIFEDGPSLYEDNNFRKVRVAYTVTFDVNGTLSYQLVAHGRMVARPTNPAVVGRTFVNWTLNGNQYDFNNAVTSDITLVANLVSNPGTTTPGTNGSVVTPKTGVTVGFTTNVSLLIAGVGLLILGKWRKDDNN